MKISYFLALFLIVNCIVDENFLQNEFSSFMKAYNKSYSDKNEERERFNFFKKIMKNMEISIHFQILLIENRL